MGKIMFGLTGICLLCGYYAVFKPLYFLDKKIQSITGRHRQSFLS